MQSFFLALIIGVVLSIVFLLYRVFKGPTIYDRLNGLTVIGTDTILLVVLIGFYNNRPDMYVDISIAYGLLGFITLVVLAKFIGAKGDPGA